MTTENTKVVAIIGAVVALFAVGMAVMASRGGSDGTRDQALSEQQASSESSAVPGIPDGAVVSYRDTLEGEYVNCLPVHDNFSDPTCRPGMRMDDGSYYAVSFAMMSQEMTPLEAGERFKANGLVTPIEMLSSDQWQGVIAKGIFSVTDSVERL